ncbi:Sec14p-like phosphatidylinositol transfer family protein isoform 5 [Hibiscus syriacus]|uniref:Sec14p-like phosphatidylinositol transfer family protein isoform 5 n=1 Tax=Hibiscus syriacus TaxID=106335 RepID=A0A6A2X3X4_HIBSY|nr:Sec14p-like phosphatidylinositol transfer family protein isoform 5 [Hibiscus syriacus]
MSATLEKSTSNGSKKSETTKEQQAKISEIRKLIGPLPEKLAIYGSDAAIARYLRARNWNVKKATKMLKETLKWRAEYKPEEIRWEEIAHEAETGKIYRANYVDKHGRTVLVMRPSCQNTKSTKGQIRYLVYCMENAILNLPPDKEQMVWLIDFNGYNMRHTSMKVTRETAHVLQDHYPERLGVAILYNPPKFFEPFWKVVKPFLEPKTQKKVKFVYSDDPSSKKIMEDLFDMEKLESAFGGYDYSGFNISHYAERMRGDDKRMSAFWTRGNPPSAAPPQPMPTFFIDLNSINLNSDSSASDNGKVDSSPSHVSDSETLSPNGSFLVNEGSDNGTEDIHYR